MACFVSISHYQLGVFTHIDSNHYSNSSTWMEMSLLFVYRSLGRFISLSSVVGLSCPFFLVFVAWARKATSKHGRLDISGF